jgi:hypothetical protein
MSTPDDNIESILRRSPQPRPPAGLKEKLMRPLHPPSAVTGRSVLADAQESWARRWWPALVPAGLSLICMAVFGVQQRELRGLKKEVQTLSAEVAAETPTPAASVTQVPTEPLAAPEPEIVRLKGLVEKLSTEISRLEQLRAQNQNLRSQLASPGGLATAETGDARERADQARCINNMKQLGLAVRVWAGDNNDAYPPDIVSMTNEMGTPKILLCPSDTGRPVASAWSEYSSANCSYEYLGGTETEPTRVMFRCPFHGNIGLCDGSVQGRIGKLHPEWLVQRDGKLYFERPLTR